MIFRCLLNIIIDKSCLNSQLNLEMMTILQKRRERFPTTEFNLV